MPKWRKDYRPERNVHNTLMQHILLTGANSFIAPFVIKQLIKNNYRVTAVSRQIPVSMSSAVTFLPVDLSRIECFLGLPRDVDAIIHIAATLPVPGTGVAQMVADNIIATQNVIIFAKQCKARKIIYTSTRSVYGKVENAIVDEMTEINDPSTYGLTKYAGEVMLEHDHSAFSSVAIRLPGILGYKAKRHWIPDILEQIMDGRRVYIYNPDAQFNNAMHADALGRFICELLTRSWSGFHAFPIGAGNCLSVKAVVERLICRLESSSQIEIGPSIRNTYTISSHIAMNRFGYKPERLENILDQYADEFSGAFHAR